MQFEQVTFLSRGSLYLQGILHAAAGIGPKPAAVVCHPHPLGGGAMHNGVVAAVARSLAARGITALRFNFRGVGGSQGEHDHGLGEQDDVAGAFDWLTGRPDVDPRRVALVGYSFGAWVASLVAQVESKVAALAAICPVALDIDASRRDARSGAGPSLRLTDFEPGFLQSFDRPKLLIGAEHDQFAPAWSLANLFQRLPEPKSSYTVGGADHFLSGAEAQVGEAVSSFLAEL
jgi:alpha/beta superfamily hydrolase